MRANYYDPWRVCQAGETTIAAAWQAAAPKQPADTAWVSALIRRAFCEWHRASLQRLEAAVHPSVLSEVDRRIALATAHVVVVEGPSVVEVQPGRNVSELGRVGDFASKGEASAHAKLDLKDGTVIEAEEQVLGPAADVDVLVAADDRRRALAELGDAGFSPAPEEGQPPYQLTLAGHGARRVDHQPVDALRDVTGVDQVQPPVAEHEDPVTDRCIAGRRAQGRAIRGLPQVITADAAERAP